MRLWRMAAMAVRERRTGTPKQAPGTPSEFWPKSEASRKWVAL